MSTITTTFAYEDKGFAAIAAKLDFFREKVEKPLGGLKKLNTAGANLMKAFAPLAPLAMGAGAAFLGMGAAAAAAGLGLQKAFNVGADLDDLHAQTGGAVEDLAILEQAFDLAGLGAAKVGPSINRLQKALTGVNEEGEPTNKVFSQLGINLEELKAMSSTDQIDTIGKAIAGLSTPAERTATAMGLFGKSGAEMLVLFEDTGILGDAARDLGSQAQILQKNAALFGRVSDGLGVAGLKLQGFFVGMADQVAPVILPLLEFFRNTDFAPVGQKIGAAIALGFQGLTDGSIWGIVGDGALIAAGKAVNFLWKGTMGVVASAGQALIESFEDAALYFQVLGTPDFWKGMGLSILGIAAKFGAALLNAAADLVDALSDMPLFGDAMGREAEAIRYQARTSSEAADLATQSGFDSLKPTAEKIRNRQRERSENLSKALRSGFDSQGDVLDLSAETDRFKSKLAEAGAKLKQLQSASIESTPEKRTHANLDFSAGTVDRKGSGASRLTSIGSFGTFLKDPLIAEARNHTQLLRDIKRNTEPKDVRGPRQDLPLRFAF